MPAPRPAIANPAPPIPASAAHLRPVVATSRPARTAAAETAMWNQAQPVMST
ncbi:hypothetical protein JNW88_13380 [Micromonospora sp. ATA32]|nr:hypothetical protein [Micromonospora sp. ATA32]